MAHDDLQTRFKQGRSGEEMPKKDNLGHKRRHFSNNLSALCQHLLESLSKIRQNFQGSDSCRTIFTNKDQSEPISNDQAFLEELTQSLKEFNNVKDLLNEIELITTSS